MIEFICNISNLQMELENKIIELNDLEKENQKLMETNKENDLKREKIIENLNLGMSELEEAKGYVKKLEEERNFLTKQSLEAQFKIDNLKNLENSQKEKIIKIENLLKERENTIADLNKLVEQQTLLENKLLEYKDKFHFQKEEFERIIYEKENLEKTKNFSEEKIHKMEISLREKELILKEFENKMNNYKVLYEDEKSKAALEQSLFKEKELEAKKEINRLSNNSEEKIKILEKLSNDILERERELNQEIKENDRLNYENVKYRNEYSLMIIENSKLNDKLREEEKNVKSMLEKIEFLNKDYFDIKQNYDIACLDSEESKKLNQELIKEIEINKSEKNNYYNLYEREKKEVFHKENQIRSLEKEINKKASIVNNMNKFSNLSLFNLKSGLKNILTMFDSYSLKLSVLKKEIITLDDEHTYDNNERNFNKKETDGEFNFKKFLLNDREKKYINFDRKRKDKNENLNYNLNEYYNNEDQKNLRGNNKRFLDFKSQAKDLIFNFENFEEWIDKVKVEINVNN